MQRTLLPNGPEAFDEENPHVEVFIGECWTCRLGVLDDAGAGVAAWALPGVPRPRYRKTSIASSAAILIHYAADSRSLGSAHCRTAPAAR
jgi:hypothetical protein